jgi:hypothetical protein
MSDISQIFSNIPPITKTYLGLSFLTSLALKFEYVKDHELILNWSRKKEVLQ